MIRVVKVRGLTQAHATNNIRNRKNNYQSTVMATSIITSTSTSTVASSFSSASRIGREHITKQLIDIVCAKNFDHTAKRNNSSKLMYRIPWYQRFPKGKMNEEKVVDSVIRNFPISEVILIQQCENNKTYYDIQEGQTRLTILQRFTQDKFTWNGQYYSQLSRDELRAFDGYLIPCEILIKPDDMDNDMFQSLITEIFDRVNSGTPLNDRDRFYAHMGRQPHDVDENENTAENSSGAACTEPSTVIKFAYDELPRNPEFKADIKRFMLNVQSKSNIKTRGGIDNFTGLVMTLMHSDPSHITTSYLRNSLKLSQHPYITADQKEGVYSFLRFYFSLLKEGIPADARVPLQHGCKTGHHKIGTTMGMVLMEWLQGKAMVNRAKWVWYIRKVCTSPHFRHKTLFQQIVALYGSASTTPRLLQDKINCMTDLYEHPEKVTRMEKEVLKRIAHHESDEDDDTESVE